eukprot:gene29358-12443_t
MVPEPLNIVKEEAHSAGAAVAFGQLDWADDFVIPDETSGGTNSPTHRSLPRIVSQTRAILENSMSGFAGYGIDGAAEFPDLGTDVVQEGHQRGGWMASGVAAAGAMAPGAAAGGTMGSAGFGFPGLGTQGTSSLGDDDPVTMRLALNHDDHDEVRSPHPLMAGMGPGMPGMHGFGFGMPPGMMPGMMGGMPGMHGSMPLNAMEMTESFPLGGEEQKKREAIVR